MTVVGSTVTEVNTVTATEYATVLGTEIVTETESTIAATETVFFTESSSVTVGTETVSLRTTETTIASTETVFQTITLPARTFEKKRDIDTLTFVEPTSSAPVESAPVQTSPTLPAYALDCPSFDKYKSACKCVGAALITVTEPMPVSTVTVDETTVSFHGPWDQQRNLANLSFLTKTVFASVAATVTTTEAELVSVTATASATTTVVIEDVETVTATQTDVVSLTATVTATETATLAPEPVQPVCQINTDAFRATDKYNGNDLYIYANMLNALSGGAVWQAGTTSTNAAVQNKYNLGIDSEGYLYVHDRILPYSYTYYFYIQSPSSTGSVWPQVGTQTSIDSAVAQRPDLVSKIKACVNPATGELTVQDYYGRKNMLWCGNQLWLSHGVGEDVNRGSPCQQMFPKAVAPYKP